MGLIGRLLGRSEGGDRRDRLRALYDQVIVTARRPHWYMQGGVPDTLDGRFDMVALVMALVLNRLQQDGPARAEDSVALTELFIDDMDGQLRQIGIGDFVVGKHMGRLLGALGGRLNAYRDGLAGGDAALRDALVRNLYRGTSPDEPALAWMTGEVRALNARITMTSTQDLVEGRL